MMGATVISCKKNNENQKPIIEIVSPSVNTTFNVDETINVKVKASDDVEIKLIKVVINDENSVAITASQSFSPNLKNTEKTFVFKLNDLGFKSGKYFISVMANDGELETKKYLEINLNELPKTYTGFITSQQTGNNSLLNLYNKNNTKESTFLFEGDFTDAVFFSSHQVLLGYGVNAKAKAFKIPSFSQTWEYTASSIKNLSVKDDRFFLLKSDNYTTGYTVSDFVTFKSYYEPSFIFSPACAAVGINTICVFQMQPNLMAQKKIICYDLNTTSILKEFLTNNIIKSIIHIKDELFAIHQINTNSQHQIGLYNASTNVFSDVFTYDEIVKSIVQLDVNNLLVLTDSGLGILNLQNLNFQMILNQINITDFEYESLNNEIYLTRNNLVEKYSVSGNLIASTSLDHQPKSITLLYNK
jgi:hypothetical protein